MNQRKMEKLSDPLFRRAVDGNITVVAAYELMYALGAASVRASANRLRDYKRRVEELKDDMIHLLPHPTSKCNDTPYLTLEGALAVYKAMTVKKEGLEFYIKKLYAGSPLPAAQPAPKPAVEPEAAAKAYPIFVKKENGKRTSHDLDRDTDDLCKRIKRYKAAHEAAGIDLSLGNAKEKFEAWVYEQSTQTSTKVKLRV